MGGKILKKLWQNKADKSQHNFKNLIIFPGAVFFYFCVLQNFSCVFALLFLHRGFFLFTQKMFLFPFAHLCKRIL